MSHSNEIQIVLFDVGGVLVETSGVATILSWMNHRISAQELWKIWLTSPCVRAFETGQTDPMSFAIEIISTMELPVAPQQFLDEMATWSTKLISGAMEMVDSIPRKYTRATLCNTNAVHWPRLMSNPRLAGGFEFHFASHLMGKLKPDKEVFEEVRNRLRCHPAEILFLDDNQLNVDGARAAGLNAVRVNTVAAATRSLTDFGVLS